MLLLLTACGGSSKSSRLQADQQIESLYQSRDYQHLLLLCDTLEGQGSLSAVKANYWRGYAADRLKQREAAERYWQAALQAGAETRDAEDLALYAKTAARLANLFSVRGRYADVLTLAQPVVARLETLECDTTSDYVNLLIYIGCCQAAEGQQVEESDHGFYRAYRKHVENIQRTHSDAAYKDAIAGLITVAYYCVQAERYQEALRYTSGFGELLGEYEQRPDARKDYVDKQLGRYNFYKYQALRGLARNEEAQQALDTFLQTDFSRSPEGLALTKQFQDQK